MEIQRDTERPREKQRGVKDKSETEKDKDIEKVKET